MFYRILKKDLKHKLGINIILFLFMILSTVFVASSVNNIFVIFHLMDYNMDKGQVADEYVCAYGEDGEKNIEEWLTDNNLVKDFSKNEAVILSQANISSFNGEDGKEYQFSNTTMLQSQWQKNMLIFDTNGKLVTMKDGEIGMKQKDLDQNGLKLGDTIKLKFGNTYKTFKIAEIIMDPAFGGDYVGMTRYIISEHDFQEIKDTGISLNYNYNINIYDKDAFEKALNKEAFQIIISLDSDMFAYTYVMSMVTAGILIIVGICLIVIAFLILRFTIVFTLQEDYKDIGIMKAIGIRNFMIKKIYLAKYLVIVCAAAVIGCFISVPVSNRMLQSVSKTMLMENAGINFNMNVLCSIGVAFMVILICFLCTNKLRKFSAMEAIRNGQTGERFNSKSVLSLHKCKKLRVPLFMAFNDIFSSIKRFIVLILTFAIGTVIIILPLNAISSLGSDEMVKNMALDLSADFYVSSDSNTDSDTDDVALLLNKEAVTKQLESINDNFKDKNYDIDINTLIFGTFSYYVEDEDDIFQVMTMIPLNTDGAFIDMLDGTKPVNANEIALSEKVMKKLGVNIGDTIHMKNSMEDTEYIVTGSYQNFMQMGQSAFMSENAEVKDQNLSGIWYYQCYLNHQNCNSSVLKQIREDFPEYKIFNVKQILSDQLGSTVSQLSSLKVMLVFLVCIINVLITVLMMKIFIMSERSQIAMLRSIGYSIRTIRTWLVLRMGIVLVVGVIIGALFSIPLNTICVRPIFGMMGATHMKIQVDALEAYFIYPCVLLIVILIAAFLSSASIKKFNLMDINNAE